MKVVSVEKADNCLDGEFIFMYTFDGEWLAETIQGMGRWGELRYFASFPRPMFELKLPDGTMLKGVQGLNECRAVFPRQGTAEAKATLEGRFESLARFWTGLE
jgi:hypothetical protein